MKLNKILSAVTAFSLVTTMAVSSLTATGPTEVPAGANAQDEINGGMAGAKIYMNLPVFDGTTLLFDVFNQSGTGTQVFSKDLTFTNLSTASVTVALSSYKLDVTSVAGYNATADDNWVYVTSAPAGIDSNVPESGTGAAKGKVPKNIFLWINEADKNMAGNPKKTVDGKFVYPTWNPTAAPLSRVLDGVGVESDLTTAVLQADGIKGTQVFIADPVPFTTLERGYIAAPDFDYAKKITIPEGILGTRNTTTIKFDGALNADADWAAGDTIKITPTFSIKMAKVEVIPTPTVNISKFVRNTAGSAVKIIVTAPAGMTFKALDATTAPAAFDIDYGTTGFNGVVASAVTSTSVTFSFTSNGVATAKAEIGEICIRAKAGTLLEGITPSSDPSGAAFVTVYQPQAVFNLTSTEPPASAFAGSSNVVITLQSDILPETNTTAVDAANYAIKVTDSSGVEKTVTWTTATKVTVSASGLVTVTLKTASPIAAGDKITFTLKTAAFPTGNGTSADTSFTVTVQS